VLYRKAWAVFSEYIRRRDKGVCCTCGSINNWKDTNAGHYKHGVLDFDEMNINCQCVGCNKWNHGRLDRYGDFLRGKYGEETYKDLVARASLAKKGHKYTSWGLEFLIKQYAAKIECLKT
jgi:hypothetical protein